MGNVSFIDILFYLLFFGNGVFFIISLLNFFSFPVLSIMSKKISSVINQKNNSLSVIVPARNEEKNIETLLQSLSSQTYPIDRIIVVDDNSSDKTAEMVMKCKVFNEKIQLLKGKELPPGWTGKNYALFQGQEGIESDYLLFIDADVNLANTAIEKAMKVSIVLQADLLSIFPEQYMKSVGEKLVVPLMNWFLLSFLVLKSTYRTPIKIFVAANGQFMLIRNAVYQKLGTHKAFREYVVEDMAIAKALRHRGRRIVTLTGKGLIHTRMYHSFREALDGFSKNFFPGLGFSSFSFIAFLLWACSIFILPHLLIFFDLRFIIITLLFLLSRLMQLFLTAERFITIFLYPLQLLLFFYLGGYSLFNSHKGKNIWKGREIKTYKKGGCT